jgi:membrane protein DedA with SNARE-associated domain
VWNAIGAATWATTVITLGYVLGRRVASLVDRFSKWSAVALVVLVAAWWVVRVVRRRNERAKQSEPTAATKAD